MVDDELAARFIRIDRLRVRERDRSGAERVTISVAVPFPVRVSGGYAHAIGHRTIGATRRG